jgi:predicted lipoprotein with Yx(FWY)xxD motif
LSLSIAAGASLALSACGSSTKTATVAPVAAEAPVASEAAAVTVAKPAAGAAVALKAASSSLGQILVDAQGRTLYAFTNDVNAQTTCTGTCAEAWPPQIVDESWTVAPGLDSGIFSTSARGDGTLQLMAGKFPLYYFSGDAKPGDVNGQGSGNRGRVWCRTCGGCAHHRRGRSYHCCSFPHHGVRQGSHHANHGGPCGSGLGLGSDRRYCRQRAWVHRGGR